MAINLQCTDCQTGNVNPCNVNPTITTSVPNAAAIAATVRARATNAVPTGGNIGCAGAGDTTVDVTKFIRQLSLQNAKTGGQGWQIGGPWAAKIAKFCGTQFQATWNYTVTLNIRVTGNGSGTVNCACQKKCDNCAGCGDCSGSSTDRLPTEQFKNPASTTCTVTYNLSATPLAPGQVPGQGGGPNVFAVRPFFQKFSMLAPGKKGGKKGGANRGGANRGGGKQNAGGFLQLVGNPQCTDPPALGLPDANAKAEAVAGSAFGKAAGKMKSCGNDPQCGQYITGGTASGSCTITVT